MATLLEAGYDLGGLAGCLVLIALLSIVSYTFTRLASALDFSVFGVRPLHHAATAIEHTIVAGCDDGIKALERVATRFFNGLIDSLAIFVGLAVLVGLGVKDALGYLWSHALGPFVRAIADPIRTVAAHALAEVGSLAATVAHNLTRAESYAEGQADRALADAKAYTRELVQASQSAAERFASEAVGKLRAAEDAALAGAVAATSAAIHAGELAAERGDTAAERIAHAELATAEAAFGSALGTLEGLTDKALNDLRTIEGAAGAAGIAALIAAIPAIATLVQAIATEAGLDSSECRGKVKRICGTDPSEWLNLLEGGLFLTGILSLRELVPVARGVVHELRDVIAEAA